jgi:UDP-N-acetylglucosamine 2-epimerase
MTSYGKNDERKEYFTSGTNDGNSSKENFSSKGTNYTTDKTIASNNYGEKKASAKIVGYVKK